ncbi:hypothetical protein WH47_05522 [Habropoda laboriosa]|uniref:Uncharacterized protein n=1 Tax=Habropoda laboriosa TaxID=597456 RepID=A0A0L7RFI0_9HYME|nr:hypothetical protein WH47_05522 [Habropoda laboriosa]
MNPPIDENAWLLLLLLNKKKKGENKKETVKKGKNITKTERFRLHTLYETQPVFHVKRAPPSIYIHTPYTHRVFHKPR